MMKECSNCCNVLPITQYSPQRTKPNKLYAWCDECRKESTYVSRQAGRKCESEYNLMRQKAKEMRRFDNDGALALLAEFEAGIDVKSLSTKYKCSTTTVYTTMSRARVLNKV